jgi:hypothetical protein
MTEGVNSNGSQNQKTRRLEHRAGETETLETSWIDTIGTGATSQARQRQAIPVTSSQRVRYAAGGAMRGCRGCDNLTTTGVLDELP